MASASIKFGTIQINPNYLFFTRGGVFAMVVHNPIAKGRKKYILLILLDILVCPKNPIARYRDLDTKELFEISLTV